ncbi:MAG: hypothetical protein B7X77_02360, partial [Caulobacter sp. 39-67-4]
MTVSSSAATRNAVVFLAVIAGGAALLWMRDILTPLALAVFLAVMIDGFARVLMAKARFAKRLALPTAIVLSISLFGLSVWVVAENSASFVDQLKDYAPRLNDVIARLAHALGIQVAPTVADLILDSISLSYHETLMAAAGSQAEDVLAKTVREHKGKYIALVEGSIPTGADGAYCTIGGKAALDIAREICGNAAATIAVGTCAAFGGIPAARPNPTGALSVADAVPGVK